MLLTSLATIIYGRHLGAFRSFAPPPCILAWSISGLLVERWAPRYSGINAAYPLPSDVFDQPMWCCQWSIIVIAYRSAASSTYGKKSKDQTLPRVQLVSMVSRCVTLTPADWRSTLAYVHSKFRWIIGRIYESSRYLFLFGHNQSMNENPWYFSRCVYLHTGDAWQMGQRSMEQQCGGARASESSFFLCQFVPETPWQTLILKKLGELGHDQCQHCARFSKLYST